MSTAQPWPRYVCVLCCKDWTTDLENVADAPGASIDALCECDQLILAEGAEPGVFLIEGLVVAESHRGSATASAILRGL
ncbi:MAG TPA: hypothetical protein VIX82_12160 [Solirubrobacteraceae bacterium]